MSLNIMLVFFSPLPDRLDTGHIFTHLNSKSSHALKSTCAETQAITPKLVLKLTGKRLCPRCFYCGNKSVFSTFLLTFNRTRMTFFSEEQRPVLRATDILNLTYMNDTFVRTGPTSLQGHPRTAG